MENKILNLATSQVPSSTKRGKKIEWVNKEDMETCILQENESKYHQTEGTSQLQTGHLLQDFGTMGNGAQVEVLMAGNYTAPGGTSPITREFLHLMKRPLTVKAVPPITFSEFHQGWA
jgi:hypothetical protein